MKVVWKFSPIPSENSSSCLIDFAVSFSFQSPTHSLITRMFLDTVVKDNVNAFISRADSIFGPSLNDIENEA